MEKLSLNPATLAPVPESKAGEPRLSLNGIVGAKLWAARRRRRSFFIPHRCENDIGNCFLSHADFPKARAKSLTALGVQKKEEFKKQGACRILEQTMNTELSLKKYDAKECSASSHKIAKLAKERICSTYELTGCKVICLCYITKRAKPSLTIDSGCAWDELKSTIEKDAFVDFVYKNQDIVAVASVFVIHCRRLGSKKTASDLLEVPPKAGSASMSEPARKRKDSSVFTNMPQLQRGEMMR